ncbi:CDGSH iron-sulfur domain-containing protein [Microbacterium sp. R86528]|uniref:CDGSH iron-sulfur domain-containing protein n=1 Tax=Microbacterium sp. R86528 TaxID=3093864 RepID=UPI0037C4F967
MNDSQWPSIAAYPNGPLIVRGPVEITGADGEPLERQRETVALCRCGLSVIKPWCDGSHKLSGFRA